ncbi:MoaD/ThiS family protein [Halobellus sp. Atlit-31R]|nr:MoaD/ThiS family protein [Halobellus sp. Atlit-31R]
MDLTVYGPLRGVTGEKTITLDPDGRTVQAAVDTFIEQYPSAATQLTDDAGALRPSVRVLLDGESAALEDPLPPGASMTLFPAMRGG